MQNIKVIEGNILFEKFRIGFTFIATVVVFIIGLIAFQPGPEDVINRIIMGDNYHVFFLILCTPLIYLFFYGLGFFVAQKKVSFHLDKEKNILSLFISNRLMFQTSNYNFKKEIRRVGDSFLQIIGNVFFHLEIADDKGTKYHFFERLDSRDIVKDVSPEPARIMNKLIPRTPTKYPDFIFDTYEMLEEQNSYFVSK